MIALMVTQGDMVVIPYTVTLMVKVTVTVTVAVTQMGVLVMKATI